MKNLRQSIGLSQQELADRIGIGQTTISDYEGDRREPTARALIKLARFFNVSTDYLLGLTDNPQPWKNDLPEAIRKQLEEYQILKERYQQLVDKLLRIAEDIKRNS